MTTLADITIGSRVELTEDVDNFPTIYVSKGRTGSVASIDAERVMITLDDYRKELDEWDNQLEVFLEHYENGLPFRVTGEDGWPDDVDSHYSTTL